MVFGCVISTVCSVGFLKINQFLRGHFTKIEITQSRVKSISGYEIYVCRFRQQCAPVLCDHPQITLYQHHVLLCEHFAVRGGWMVVIKNMFRTSAAKRMLRISRSISQKKTCRQQHASYIHHRNYFNKSYI